MIGREKLEKLAKVMGGREAANYMGNPIERAAIWGEDDDYLVWDDGQYEPGTLESLEQKVREWVDTEGAGVMAVDFTYWTKPLPRHEITFMYNDEGLGVIEGDSRLSTLIDAVLWIAEQEQGQGGKA